MKIRTLKIGAIGLIGAAMVAALAAWAAAPANYYGNPASPDQYGNTVLGAVWQASSSTVSNIVIGYGSGPASCTNSIYLFSAGTAGDINQIRIGTPGTQTNCVIAGTVQTASGIVASNTMTSSNGFASYGTYSWPLVTLQFWTNTNAFSVTLTYTNGVTNLCFSNSTPAVLFRSVTNAGVYGQHMPPGSIVTNSAAGAVAWQE